MENTQIDKYTRSFGLSFAITSLISAVLVILKESNEDTLLKFMKSFGHHWVTHGIFNLIVFLVIGFIFLKSNGGEGVKLGAGTLVNYIFGSVVLSYVLIAGFYLLH